MSEQREPFCWHSRRWLMSDWRWTPPGCPHAGPWCKEDRCGLYEEREPTNYLRRKLHVLRQLEGKEADHETETDK